MVIDAFHKVLSGWTPVFVLENTPEDKARKNNYGSDYSPVTANSLAILLGHCMILGLTSEVDQIFGKLIHIAERPSFFPISLLDCLGHLCSILPKCHRIEDTQLGRFARTILNVCATRYIGVKPTRDLDWARTARGCGCPDCQLLDGFLLDHDRESDSFALANYSSAVHLDGLLPKSWGRATRAKNMRRKRSIKTVTVSS